MPSPRHFGILSSDYIALLAAIRQIGVKVPCEWEPANWFPEDIANPAKRRLAEQKAVEGCNRCPVMEECFTYALERGEKYGIWGGSLPSER